MKKAEELSTELISLVAARFKVLAEPLRLEMLQHLKHGEASVSSIAAAVGATQPNVSKHLKIMQDDNLVARRRDGNTVWYRIADPSVFELCDVVCGSLRHSLHRRQAILT